MAKKTYTDKAKFDEFTRQKKLIRAQIKELVNEQYPKGSAENKRVMKEEMKHGDEMSDLRGTYDRRIKEYREPGEKYLRNPYKRKPSKIKLIKPIKAQITQKKNAIKLKK